MSPSPAQALQRLHAEHSVKMLRYCAVSVVNVVVSLSVLAFCHGVARWPALGANLAAWLVSTGPAYLMSRAWVWRQRGPHRLTAEVLAFWVLALIGLAASSLAVGLVERFSDRTAFVLAANIAAYGAVWLGKYLFLDQVMWRRPRS